MKTVKTKSKISSRKNVETYGVALWWSQCVSKSAHGVCSQSLVGWVLMSFEIVPQSRGETFKKVWLRYQTRRVYYLKIVATNLLHVMLASHPSEFNATILFSTEMASLVCKYLLKNILSLESKIGGVGSNVSYFVFGMGLLFPRLSDWGVNVKSGRALLYC